MHESVRRKEIHERQKQSHKLGKMTYGRDFIEGKNYMRDWNVIN